MASTYSVPGVYYEPRPRAEPRARVRTDVVGFIGFETRFRDGSQPSELLGTPPKGHAFRVDVQEFQLAAGLLGPRRRTVPSAVNLVLSSDSNSIPMPAGGSIRYTVMAVVGDGDTVRLQPVPGWPSNSTEAAPAPDEELERWAGGVVWLRLADVEIRRSDDGNRVFPTVVPALPPTRCDDWTDFAQQLGGLPEPDDGTFLARGVRAFFANGGARCHVAVIRRPRFEDAGGLRRARADLVGMEGAPETEATGLERLLRIFEVAIVDAPDLYARRVDPAVRTVRLPPQDRAACFRRCDEVVPAISAVADDTQAANEPLFDDSSVLETQRAMLVRCGPERWRVQLLLTTPVGFDAPSGRFQGPHASRAELWRRNLQDVLDDSAASVGAFYHPWALAQERLGAPIVELPPTVLAAGILARRDLARGPHVAPANEGVVGVVGLSPSVGDDLLGQIYEAPLHINPFRAFPGEGVQLWGARTLSSDRWLRYLPVRRCLSAIERRAWAALRPLVFEPNTPTLWFQVTQAMLGILVPLFESGALRGRTAEEAFYVRCDDTNNPPESVLLGQVLCEVGVAIAAPAEFLVFRVGRRESVVEILE